jgi:anaerobic selenocysteine-containing dehydrogenase
MASLGDDILNSKDPEIKSIWVERGNPLLQSPESTKVAKAFSRSEFTVVVEQFMTDTARNADLILPAKDIFEQSDIICSYWSPYIQFKPKILEPAGEIMMESEIYFYLAKRLGIEISDSLIPLPGNENTEKWLEKRINGVSSLTLDRLREGPVIGPGLQMIAYEDLKFDTPSGRIELYSEQLSERWGVLPYPAYIPLSADASKDDHYPLVLISPNTGSRIHSQFGNLDVIRHNSDSPAFEISIQDAEERGIKSGDPVNVFNKRGSVRTVARITGRIRQGLVILYNGIWIEEGGGSNMLTHGLETDMGFGAAFHGQRVEVEKIVEE